MLALLLCVNSIDSQAAVRVPRVWGNGAILQRDQPLTLWGWADAGETVNVKFIGKTYQTVADSKGEWSVVFPAQKAGGPYELKVNDLTITDILIGEVWVCSGQSNMETTVNRVAIRYPYEVTSYNNTRIREFNPGVEYAFDGPHKDTKTGEWRTCTQEYVGEFSAIGYFMAKELYEKFDVPIGIITNAVGGSPIEAWMSSETLPAFGYKEALDRLQRPGYVDSVQQASRPKMPEGAAPVRMPRVEESLPDVNDKDWTLVDFPGFMPINGTVWFKTEFTVPKGGCVPSVVILGTIINSDQTYINGKKVGNTTYQYPPRIYTIPADVLQEGTNQLLVKVNNSFGQGGFTPEKDYSVYIGAVHPFYDKAQRISLIDNKWYIKKGPETPRPQRVPGATYTMPITWQYQPTSLYNAMLTPFTHLPVRGVLWFQGESGNETDYDQRLLTMMKTWRDDWNDPDLPIIVLQLAGYTKDMEDPNARCQMALRRNDQRKAALADPNAQLVVTLDLGEWNDIHPLSKKEVAARVTQAAYYLAYGDKKAVLTPQVSKIECSGAEVLLTFSDVGKGLTTSDGKTPQTFRLKDKDGDFVEARATIVGKNKVRVSAPSVTNPVAIRYAWNNFSAASNLQNKGGHPATPFEFEVPLSK